MLTSLSQTITHSSFLADWLSFKTNARSLKTVQGNILDKTLKNHPFLKNKKEFLSLPVMDYNSLVTKLSSSPLKPNRYQPTSGSGEKEKLIPYTQDFISQLNKALNPWLFDTFKKHPGIIRGKHYWSISWLPTHWRRRGWELDDFELLPAWKKQLTRKLLAVPNEVSRAPTLESSQFATLAFLVATTDLTFISVWSPTFFLQLLDLLTQWKEPLKDTLLTGKWQLFGNELKFLKAPRNWEQAARVQELNFQDLWPELKLVSSWDSSTSAGWALKLSELFPKASFQGKGLWATEGVVTVPFENQFVLSYLSHYYEFLDLKSGNLLSSWELKEGQEVHPVLTCANGFTRYHLKDRLVVTGHYHQIPALEFLERDNSYDMVGEKLDAHAFLQLHDALKERFPHLQWVNGFAVNDKTHKPYYCFVFEGEEMTKPVLTFIQEQLDEHFHYHLARELGQLGKEKVLISKDAFSRYEHYQMDRGMVQGNIKVELACLIRTEKEGQLFHEHFIERT